MNRGPDLLADDDEDLSLDTLDQWETELDQFAAGIMQRLSRIAGSKVDISGLVPQSQTEDLTDDPTEDGSGDNNQAMQLLQSLREMTP